MVAPLVGYAAVVLVSAGAGAAATWWAQRDDGGWEEIGSDFAKGLLDAGVPLASAVGEGTLTGGRGLGGAIVDGIDSAFDAVRDKLRGHEPDVVAGITVGGLTILFGVYLWFSIKNARDAL